MPSKPDIGIAIPPAWALRYQLENPPLHKSIDVILSENFRGLNFLTGFIKDPPPTSIEIFPVIRDIAQVHEEIDLYTFNAIAGFLDNLFKPFASEPASPNEDLEKTTSHEITSNFMDEIIQLYGFIAETDVAMVMAAQHFKDVEASNPDGSSFFIRHELPVIAEWAPPHQYEAKNVDIVRNFRGSGRNHILRNRAVIIFLYTIWDEKYRKAISDASGHDIANITSDIFGDLRLYRNAIVHNNGKLNKKTKLINFTELDCDINLTEFSENSSQLDKLFHLIADELNRLSVNYLNTPSNLSLNQQSAGFLVQEGPRWES